MQFSKNAVFSGCLNSIISLFIHTVGGEPRKRLIIPNFRVNYYGKTYYIKVEDINDDGNDDDVVGFYSVNLDGLPFIVTGLDIRDHPRVR